MTNESTLDRVSKKENRVSRRPLSLLVPTLVIPSPIPCWPRMRLLFGVLPFSMKAVIIDNTRRSGYHPTTDPLYASFLRDFYVCEISSSIISAITRKRTRLFSCLPRDNTFERKNMIAGGKIFKIILDYFFLSLEFFAKF